MQRRSNAVWLFLLRNGRFRKHYKNDAEQDTDKDTQDSGDTEDDDTDTSQSDMCNDHNSMRQRYIRYVDSSTSTEPSESCLVPVVSDKINSVCEPARSTIQVISNRFLTADKLPMLRLSSYVFTAGRNFGILLLLL